MSRYVMTILMVVVMLVSNPARADKLLSEKGFTEAYVVRLKSIAPALKIEKKGTLELELHGADGKQVSIWLGNAYNSYRKVPESRDAILDDFARTALDTMHASDEEAAIDTRHIVPVVKDAGYIASIKATLGDKAKDPSKFDIYFEPLNQDLVVLYAVDNEHSIKFLGKKELASVKLGAPQLHKISLDNLKQILPKIEKYGNNGTYMLSAGGSYEASLLLIDSLWSKDKLNVRGDLVVSVPSRDMVLVTGSKDADGLAKVRKIAHEVSDGGSYTLTERLFLRKDNTWVRFE